MWYNQLSEYLTKEGYKSNVISPCVFIKRSISSFIIITVISLSIKLHPEDVETF
jgi:hypothetical protein